MKKEDLKIGKELQSRIVKIDNEIERLKFIPGTPEKEHEGVQYCAIKMSGNQSLLSVNSKESCYTDKAATNLEYLNQLYRDNVLRTLEDCKKEREKEFELLGK